MNPFRTLFDPGEFMPHGMCLLWRKDLFTLHVLSDVLIALSYFSIPAAILYYVWGRDDLIRTHRRIGLLFATFIMACGLTHIMSIVVLWEPLYWLDGFVKLITAFASVPTALAVWKVMPRVLALPSAMDFKAESDAHKRTAESLRVVTAGLEKEVEVRTNEAEHAAKRFRLALKGSQITVYEQAEDMRYVWIENQSERLFDRFGTIIGKTEAEIGVDPEVSEMKRRVVETHQPEEIVTSYKALGEQEWWHIRIQPSSLEDGRPGLIGCASNITDIKNSEQHLQLVLREMTHRSKNLLGVVQAIAQQTAKTSLGGTDFSKRFSARLRSLAASHDLIASERWAGASLADLAHHQLGHILGAYPDRVSAKGDHCVLAVESIQYIGLALHELSTNAVKHGALKEDGTGQVDLSWTCVDGVIDLNWTETGCPTDPAAPGKQGFGTILLEQLVPKSLKGVASMSHQDNRRVWKLNFKNQHR